MFLQKFCGAQLRKARMFRGLGLIELANQVKISKQSLSLYENDDNVPSFETINALAKELRFPYEFFFHNDNNVAISDCTYFRSLLSATKKERLALSMKLEYVAKIYEILMNYVEFPQLDIPTVNFYDSDDPVEMDSQAISNEIEGIANKTREYWQLEKTPIKNLQYILESHGIIITGFQASESKIDAFSQRLKISDGSYKYIIALMLGHKSAERLNLDMAHELGHILLHPWGESLDLLEKSEFKGREKQANLFASAFLLPKDSFGAEVALYPTKLEYYRALKRKWKVSMQAMMYRTRQLNIITANQYQYMMRQVSKHGWRNNEPDDFPGKINDTIFQGTVDVLFREDIFDAKTLIESFQKQGIFLSIQDIETILHLNKGTLHYDVTDNVIKMPLIRPKHI